MIFHRIPANGTQNKKSKHFVVHCHYADRFLLWIFLSVIKLCALNVILVLFFQ